MHLQRFSEVTDQLVMAILSVTPENSLLWAFLMENFKLGISKMSVTPENPLFSEFGTSENLCSPKFSRNKSELNLNKGPKSGS